MRFVLDTNVVIYLQKGVLNESLPPAFYSISIITEIVGADSYGNTHYLKQIEEFECRWLRVVVNSSHNPQRVVTVFFDRRLK